FRLHQFISGAGHAYATLEPPGERRVTVEGQQFLPNTAGRKRLYAVHFCRDCGQEYHPVRLRTDDGQQVFLARDIDDAPPQKPDDESAAKADDDGDADGEVFGFLTPHSTDERFFDDEVDDYPENWLQQNARG